MNTPLPMVVIGYQLSQADFRRALHGASFWVSAALRLVILPQILPGLAVLGLLVFADTWNMVEQPLILLPTPEKRPLSLAFNDILKTNTDYLYAGSALYALPIVAVYFLLFGFSARRKIR